MPDVMVVIEIQQDTVLVQLTRLRWRFLIKIVNKLIEKHT